MEITVKYFGILKENTKTDEEKIRLEKGRKLGDLIALISERHKLAPPMLEQCLIVINDRGACQLLGLETELKSGDVVLFIPQLSGG